MAIHAKLYNFFIDPKTIFQPNFIAMSGFSDRQDRKESVLLEVT